ncbi:MAG TPA: ABC transporter ATP-binding protein [Planctomycetota bacterium]|nr:ABC transporter ATP-binding protein [Planctomycetota bacterium]
MTFTPGTPPRPSMPSMPMIETENVRKNFGKKEALKPLNLSIPAGEIFAFLGPNGAGKTTTIKILCGLLRPTGGVAKIGGFDIQKQGIQARAIMAYVPDEPYLYDKLTGLENMRLVGRMYGLTETELEIAVARWIEALELKEFINELGESYSHGMKQRVVLASALVHNPRVLIVDEPMVGLDPKNMRRVKDIFLEQARGGTSIFLTIHTLSIAQEVADRIAIINHGEVIAMGNLEELQSKVEGDRTNLEELFLSLTAEETTS